MSDTLTQVHLVGDLHQAFRVADSLGALGIGLDVEGVLTPYVGNNPVPYVLDNTARYYEVVANTHIRDNPDIPHGLMTNNTNVPYAGTTLGFVDYVAANVGKHYGGTKFVHKNMQLANGTIVVGKPAGHQGKLLADMLDVPARDMVLIDDQGVKNTGEAVRAGFKAIIVPNPTGLKDSHGRMIEHKGVMRFRKFEPAIYESLRKKGTVAMAAYKIVAKIDLNQIADFVNHR